MLLEGGAVVLCALILLLTLACTRWLRCDVPENARDLLAARAGAGEGKEKAEKETTREGFTRLPSKEQITRAMQSRDFSSTVVGTARKNPARIFYKIFGEQKKGRDGQASAEAEASRLVICMGLGARGDLWKKTLMGELLKKRIQVLVVDNRGVGQSESKSSLFLGGYSMHMMAMDMKEVIDHVGWKTFHLLGHSMGGMVATELALACGKDRVISLTLMNTHAGGFLALPSTYCVGLKCKAMFTEKVLEKMLPINMKLMHGSFVHKYSDVYRRIWIEKLHDKSRYGKNGLQSFKILLKQLGAIASHYVSKARLSKLDVPTLVIAGSDDNLISPKNSQRLADDIGKSARLLVFEQCGHSINRERPEKLRDLITMHLRTQEHMREP
mmetsp:Transcript_18862/g.46289  ORF Transcript_18862/g.46289 Transcript_18862/m.46289 type:complete len:384 (+) Transcript_18862:51-1202(+)